MPDRYRLQVAGPAARAITSRLPEAAATAVIGFITGPLRDNPQRMGAALGGQLQGTCAARRGSYRVLYVINDDERIVIVKDVDHRPHAYHRR